MLYISELRRYSGVCHFFNLNPESSTASRDTLYIHVYPLATPHAIFRSRNPNIAMYSLT
jgi:hypothetical protein